MATNKLIHGYKKLKIKDYYIAFLYLFVSFFLNTDLLGYYNYEKNYIDDSTTDNTTCLMRIYI